MTAISSSSPDTPLATTPLRIAVLGAGSVGGYYGGLLARAGHSVTLIGRHALAEAVTQNGLRIQGNDFDWHIPIAASTQPDAVADADWVLVAVKSTDTETAGASIRPHLQPSARLLCLQNGVDNAERLARVLPAHEVLGAAVYVATEMAGPGHVRHHGRGELVLAESETAAQLAAVLNAARIPTTLSGNLAGVLWTKLVINCAYNALSALSRLPYGQLVQGLGVPDVMQQVVQECQAVAQAAGVALPADMWEKVQHIARTMPQQFSSTAQDLMRDKPTEIDHLNGHVVRLGQQLGIPTPANQVLWSLVKLQQA